MRETGRVERKGMLSPFPRVRSLGGHQKNYPVRPAECGLHYSVNRSVGSVPPPFQPLPPPHMVPKALIGLAVVTIKTDGWVFTFRP